VFPATALRTAGVAEARAVPHVRRVVLKLAPGDGIAERLGTGQDVGVITAAGPDRDTVAGALTRAREALTFKLE